MLGRILKNTEHRTAEHRYETAQPPRLLDRDFGAPPWRKYDMQFLCIVLTNACYIHNESFIHIIIIIKIDSKRVKDWPNDKCLFLCEMVEVAAGTSWLEKYLNKQER